MEDLEQVSPTLDSLDDELLLAMLDVRSRPGHSGCHVLTAVDLGLLEMTCRRFRAPCTLRHADGEALSLPQRAAKERVAHALAQPVRPDERRPIRPYERGVGEDHKHVLQLLESGLLTSGVLHEVPVAAVESTGWQLAYSMPYSHRTSDADLERVPPAARYVLVAAVHAHEGGAEGSALGRRRGHTLRHTLPPRAASHHDVATRLASSASGLLSRLRGLRGSSSVAGEAPAALISGGGVERDEASVERDEASAEASAGAPPHGTCALLAWGKRETVLKVTHDASFSGYDTTTDNEEEGVFWYRWPGHSFGFTSHPRLWLWLADCAIFQRGPAFEENPDDRLSWNLESYSTGGWRAGRVINLGDSRQWQKRLYYRM